MRRAGLCVLATAAATAGIAFGADPRRPVVVVRDSMDLPAGCSPRQVAGALLRFEAAFNDGDRAGLERLFAGPAEFKWFTTAQVRVLRRRELVPQLLALHARGERIRIVDIDVGRSSSRSAGLGLSHLQTSSGTSRPVHGKAEIDCARGRFYVWSTGEAAWRFCADPTGVDRESVVVACARQGRAPHAQEVGDDFAVGTTRAVLRSRCRAGAVSARVVHAIRAFNLGAAAAFARDFAASATVQPYTGWFTQLVGRAALRRFAAERDVRADGWTATAVFPPAVPGVQAAIYRVDLRVSSAGAAFGAGGVKVVIDCRSGLIAHWVGPGLAAP
jgi:hypothetical protein